MTDTEHNGYGIWAIENGETFDGLYDQPLLENPFPLAFGATWTGETTWSQTEQGVTINIHQQQDGDANGWGTLITPAGTEAVLRYELTLTITTTIPGVPTPFTTTSRVINFVTKGGMDASITITTDPLTNLEVVTASYSFEGTGGTGAPPAAVTLAAPEDGAMDVPTEVALSWNAADGADTYDVQLATDDAFTALVTDESGLTATSLTVSGLANNTTYYWRVRAVNGAGAGPWSETRRFTTASGVAVEALDEELPQAFALHQNYPNPFNPTTTLRFDLPETAFVSLTIYDMLGRMVTNLVSETLAPGRYEYAWSAEGLPGGIYIYRIEAGAFRDAGTMVLLK